MQRPLDDHTAASLAASVRAREFHAGDFIRALRPTAATRDPAPAASALGSLRWTPTDSSGTSLLEGVRFARPVGVIVALCLLVLFTILGTHALRSMRWVEYHTDIKPERIAFTDGSIAILAANSRILVRYTRDERSVRFGGGEATFEVTHAPNRPFVVAFSGGSVEAVGTRFTVRARKSRDSISVQVSEGVVKVRSALGLTPLMIAAHGVAQVKRTGEWARAEDDDVSEGSSTTLLEIAEHLNRLHPPITVKVEGSARDEHIAASLQDTAQLIDALKALDRFSVQPNGKTEVIVRLKGEKSRGTTQGGPP